MSVREVSVSLVGVWLPVVTQEVAAAARLLKGLAVPFERSATVRLAFALSSQRAHSIKVKEMER